MAEVIKMPRMSDTMTEGVIVEWHKKVGDHVEPGDVMAEVETDKATMELESYQEGTLLHIGVEKGNSVPVNGVLAVVGEEGEDYKAALENASNGSAASEETNDEPSENKSSNESSDESKNELKEKSATTGKESQKETTDSTTENDTSTQKTNTNNGHGRLKASPLAKRIAKEQGIDLQMLHGSGDGGRIVKKDLEKATSNAELSEKGQKASPIQLPQVVGEEQYEEKQVSQMRKTIAKRLSESKFSAPHFYLNMEVDMEKAMEARKSLNEIAPVKLSFNDIIVKAAALALRQHPAINSAWLGDKIRTNKHIHIGVAVAVEEGLLVPVIRFADNKTLSQISVETKQFAEKAKSKKLQPADWEGNTFTISNLGMFDIDDFTAIINTPDACILAVGKIKETPIVENGAIKIGNIMRLTLSCDHRVVDGVTGAKFMQTLKSFLEDPVRLLI